MGNLLIETNNELSVGDVIITTGYPEYNRKFNVKIGTIGVIDSLRTRYANSPNEYIIYKVSFKGVSNGDSLDHNYIKNNLEKIEKMKK